ncbi:uncharacterized protein LOC113505473 [Trichoplusia ni]|uniref:Uncharacterized protein LOC113505473 n=1 Tax=Trichoplusia ni TaxID=7111 RepID=A0A7E5WV10_TRINI|nr:uncharacterized protein LOC113505473 [Trichoplusia ni]
MAQCAVQSCNNKSGKDLPEGVTFHLFPKDPQVRQVWIDATGNGSDWKPDRHQICSEHFQEKCFQQLKKSRRLFVWAIPTLKLRNLNSPTASERAAPAPSEPEPEEPAEPDGETPELNEEIQKRKRLDEIFVKPQCATCRKRAALNVSSTKLEGQAKSIVSKVYHFLSEEFKDIKDRYGDAVDLTPLSRFRQRTAYACGVSYRAVGLVLKEEQDWMEARASPVEEPPVKKRKAARVQTDGDIESPIDSSSEDNNNEEENFQTEQSTTEAEESEPVEKETSSEGTQEETVQGTLDVNQNYDDNAETMESVSVEFEFHDMEAASNQSSQEPSIITMINQSDNENQSIPEQNIESIENLDNQSLIEPTIIAVVDSNQSNVNQVINSLNPGMKPTLIRMVDSMGNQSGLVDQALMVESGVMDQAIIEPGVNDLVMDQAMVEPAIITMIDPNLPEIEQPMFEPRFDLEPTIITVVAGDGPVIENPCGNMCW